MRSMEELQTVLISTFEVISAQDARERMRGGWLMHITTRKISEKGYFHKVYVERETFDRVLKEIETGFAEAKEESIRTPQALRRQLYKLKIIVKHKESYETRGHKDSPRVRHRCIVFNKEILDWILDVPLKAGEKGKAWRNNA